MLAQFLAWCGLRSGSARTTGPSGRVLIWAALMTLFVGMTLAVIGKALEVDLNPTAMADLLSGRNTSSILDAWTDHRHEVVFVAWLYLIVDTFLLMPSYVVLGVALSRRLSNEIQINGRYARLGFVATAVAIATLMLGLSDLVENATAAVVLSSGGASHRIQAMRIAHIVKGALALAAIVPLGLLILFWYSGSERFELRGTLPDIVWRTRYTIAMLVLFAVLTARQRSDARRGRRSRTIPRRRVQGFGVADLRHYHGRDPVLLLRRQDVDPPDSAGDSRSPWQSKRAEQGPRHSWPSAATGERATAAVPGRRLHFRALVGANPRNNAAIYRGLVMRFDSSRRSARRWRVDGGPDGVLRGGSADRRSRATLGESSCTVATSSEVLQRPDRLQGRIPWRDRGKDLVHPVRSPSSTDLGATRRFVLHGGVARTIAVFGGHCGRSIDCTGYVSGVGTGDDGLDQCAGLCRGRRPALADPADPTLADCSGHPGTSWLDRKS